MVGFDARRTQVAQSAHDFSRYFAESFGAVRVLGAVPRRPELVAPEGMSTGGGKQARQPIRLTPEGGSAPVIAVGWVDLPLRRATLRTHRCVAHVFASRFGRNVDVDQGSYNAFLDQAKAHLSACGLVVQEEDDAPASLTPPPGRVVNAASTSGFFTIAATAFVAFVVGAFAGGVAVYARFVGF